MTDQTNAPEGAPESPPSAASASPNDAPPPALPGEAIAPAGGDPGNPDKPEDGPPNAEQPAPPPVEPERPPLGFDAAPRINCEICGHAWTVEYPYTPEKCGKDDCPVNDVPPKINAADGRKSVEEVEAELAAEAEAKRVADMVKASSEMERIRSLWPLPGDANDHGGLVQVVVKGDGESLSVIAGGYEVPRGFAVMVPPYVQEALAQRNLLA